MLALSFQGTVERQPSSDAPVPAYLRTMLGERVDYGSAEKQDIEYLKFAWSKIRVQVPEPLRSRLDIEVDVLQRPTADLKTNPDGTFTYKGVRLWRKPNLSSYKDLVAVLSAHGFIAPTHRFAPKVDEALASDLKLLVERNFNARQDLVKGVASAVLSELKSQTADLSPEQAVAALEKLAIAGNFSSLPTLARLERITIKTNQESSQNARIDLSTAILEIAKELATRAKSIPINPEVDRLNALIQNIGTLRGVEETGKHVVLWGKDGVVQSPASGSTYAPVSIQIALPLEQNSFGPIRDAIVQVRLSSSHGLIRTYRGRLFSWSIEDAAKGQAMASEVQLPDAIVGTEADRPLVMDIAAGNHHYLATVTFKQDLGAPPRRKLILGWGSNARGALDIFEQLPKEHFAQPRILHNFLPSTSYGTLNVLASGDKSAVSHDELGLDKLSIYMNRTTYSQDSRDKSLKATLFGNSIVYYGYERSPSNNDGQEVYSYKVQDRSWVSGWVFAPSFDKLLVFKDKTHAYLHLLDSRTVRIDPRIAEDADVEVSLNTTSQNLYRFFSSGPGWVRYVADRSNFDWPRPLGLSGASGADRWAKDIWYSDHPTYRVLRAGALNRVKDIFREMLYLSNQLLEASEGEDKATLQKYNDELVLTLMDFFPINQNATKPSLTFSAESIYDQVRLLQESQAIEIPGSKLAALRIAVDEVEGNDKGERKALGIVRSILSLIKQIWEEGDHSQTTLVTDEDLSKLVEMQMILSENITGAVQQITLAASATKLEQGLVEETRMFVNESKDQLPATRREELLRVSYSLQSGCDPQDIGKQARLFIEQGRKLLTDRLEFSIPSRRNSSEREFLEASKKALATIQDLRNKDWKTDEAMLATLALQSEYYERARDSKYSSPLTLQLALAEKAGFKGLDPIYKLHSRGTDAVFKYVSGDFRGAAQTMLSATQKIIPSHTFGGKLLAGLGGMFGFGGGASGPTNADVMAALELDGDRTRKQMENIGIALSEQMALQHADVMKGLEALSIQSAEQHKEVMEGIDEVLAGQGKIREQLESIRKDMELLLKEVEDTQWLVMVLATSDYEYSKERVQSILSQMQRGSSEIDAITKEFDADRAPKASIVMDGLSDRFAALGRESLKGSVQLTIHPTFLQLDPKSQAGVRLSQSKMKELLNVLIVDTWTVCSGLPSRDSLNWIDERLQEGSEAPKLEQSEAMLIKRVLEKTKFLNADAVITEVSSLLNLWKARTLLSNGKAIFDAKPESKVSWTLGSEKMKLISRRIEEASAMFTGADLLLRACIAQERILIGPGVPASERIRQLQEMRGALLVEWFELGRTYSTGQGSIANEQMVRN